MKEISVVIPNLGCVIQPGVNGVTSRAQVRLPKLVLLGPTEGSVPQAFLNDGMEPGQQEVKTGTLIWSLQKHEEHVYMYNPTEFHSLVFIAWRALVTLHMRATGMLLNVLSMLALTPGGGSKTKIRPARSRFTGTF